VRPPSRGNVYAESRPSKVTRDGDVVGTGAESRSREITVSLANRTSTLNRQKDRVGTRV
jgi:hypothetical protein